MQRLHRRVERGRGERVHGVQAVGERGHRAADGEHAD